MSEQISHQSEPAGNNFLNTTFPLVVLIAVVALEALALWAAVAWLVNGFVNSSPESMRTAIALTVLVALIALWISATVIGLIRRLRWARGSTITWQVLQTAVAFGAIQGEHPQWGFALWLFAPALAAVLLAVSKPVRASFGVNETID